jgi:DNA-directed RNA polymerase specialized sigma subunit
MIRKILPSDYPEIVHLYCEQGLSQAEIAKKYGVSQGAISLNLRQLGIKTNVNRRKYDAENEQDLVNKIAELAQIDKSRKEIANELGIHYEKIKKLCQKHNIPISYISTPPDSFINNVKIRVIHFG